MSTENSPIDLFSMFREDMPASVRVAGFQQAAGELTEDVNELATQDNVAVLNGLFDIKIVFNSHGNAIHAGQTLELVHEDPFITFTESAGDRELEESSTFPYSVINAFNMRFNGAQAAKPQYTPTPERLYESYGYWVERGLLSRGSMVANIDIRSYAHRLLNALIGSDYDQQFLNQSIPPQDLRTKPFDEMVDSQKQRGQLIMHSNAVRELTSTRQVIETLLKIAATSEGEQLVDKDITSKVRALLQERKISDEDRIPVNIVYGFGHHALMHVYRGLGINITREFASSNDAPRPYKAIGNVTGQFFSAHPFDISDEYLDKYARQFILEAMLLDPIYNYFENGLVIQDHETRSNMLVKVSKIARDPVLLENLEAMYEAFQRSPVSVIALLEENGIKLSRIDAQSEF